MAQEQKSATNGTNNKLEGEGSYTATRKYNKGLAEHEKTADVEQLAEDAREAVEGDEGDELRAAEERGKRGPKVAETNESLRQSGERRKG